MKKYQEIEILRAFAIFGVVGTHTLNVTLWNYNKALFVVVAYYLNYAVSLFVLISGLVLGLKYRYNFSVISFYKKRAISIVPQYLIFSSAYILFGYLWPGYYDGAVTTLNAYDVSLILLTGYASPHFWFFVLIIKMYLIYPLLIRLIDNHIMKNRFIILALGALLIKYFWTYFNKDIRMLIGTDSSFINSMISPNQDMRSLFGYLIYFIIGIYLSSYMDILRIECKKHKYIYVFGYICLALAFYKLLKSNSQLTLPFVFNHIKGIVMIPFIFIVFFSLLYRVSVLIIEKTFLIKNAMLVIGKYSFGIYMIHLFVMLGIHPVFNWFNEAFYRGWGYCLLYFIATISLSIMLVKLISFLPYSEFAVGSSIKN